MSAESAERFVAIFIDWKPDESLEPGDKEKLCMVGLMANSQKGMPGLKSYKKTRTKKRKLDRARELLKYLKREAIEIDVFAVTGMSNGIYASWSCDAINRIRPKIGAEWVVEGTTPTSLMWNGDIYPRANVLGISLYAGILPIIALRAIKRLEAIKQTETHVKLCLDRLPLNAEAGIRLLNIFHQDEDIKTMWRDNCRNGFSFATGIFENYVDPSGEQQPGKNHPNSILVDWMAQACMAKIAPKQFQKENQFNESETDEIAAIWEVAKEQSRGSASIIDVDEPTYIEKVTRHWQEAAEKL